MISLTFSKIKELCFVCVTLSVFFVTVNWVSSIQTKFKMLVTWTVNGNVVLTHVNSEGLLKVFKPVRKLISSTSKWISVVAVTTLIWHLKQN